MLTDHDHCEDEEEVSSIKVLIAVSNALSGMVLVRSINLCLRFVSNVYNYTDKLSLVTDFRIPSLQTVQKGSYFEGTVDFDHLGPIYSKDF